ncbi:MAG: gliding motility-associated protein GldE [Lentimicrobium sp.]|nr:gliding motility-associated protein GldE [Lentimicrobium sp.]
MEDPDLDPHIQVLLVLINVLAGSITPGLIAGFLIIILLLAVSAAISSSEIAFFSLSPAQINELKNESTNSSRIIQQLLESPKKLLATILIANNFVNVAIILLSSFIIDLLFDFSSSPLMAFLIQVIVITALILLFGEIMPKIFATQYALRTAKFMAVPMQFMRNLFSPLSSLLVKSTNMIDKRIERRGHEITIDDLSEALDITTSDTNTPEDEKNILKGIVKFGDIAVREIMSARIDVTAVDEKTPFDNLLKTIIDAGYSRVPVFRESFDSVTGILYIKDLLPHLSKSGDFNWQELQRPAFFVPENKRISDLLHEFQSRKIHMAIVVDEYGGTSGLVTMEDILEEIVGEINDEFDSESDNIHFLRIDENTYIFEGKTLLNDFCKVLGIEDRIFAEAKGDSDTLAGLMLELAGKIPEKNESLQFENFTFQAETVDKRRIKRVKVIFNHNNT